MLYGFFLVIHIIISVLLVVAILMQASKGGGLAGIAGGMGAGGSSMLGGRQAATMLHKVTIGLALVFGINALLLGALSRGSNDLHSVTLDAIATEESYPLEFLGESEIDPTEEDGESAGDGETEAE